MIDTIKLTNFKCFEKQTLKLGNITLLTGLNSSGKSTFIQSLLLLRQSYYQGLLPDSGLALNGDLVTIGTAQDALFEGAVEEQIGFKVNWKDGKEGAWLFNYNRVADVLRMNNPAASSAGLFHLSENTRK